MPLNFNSLLIIRLQYLSNNMKHECSNVNHTFILIITILR